MVLHPYPRPAAVTTLPGVPVVMALLCHSVTQLVCPAVHNEGIMDNIDMLPQGKFHYDV